MITQPLAANAAAQSAQSAQCAQSCASTEAAAVIQDEISAIADAKVAATETNSNPWAVAEDEERHHEADDLVSELKVQLKAELNQAKLAADCRSAPSKPAVLKSLSRIASALVTATDGEIGHVKSFIFDEASWAIRYLVADTGNWWPGGKTVLIATQWIDDISWTTNTVRVKLTREQVKSSPEYQEALPIDRDYEERLHDAYDRKGYWR